MTLKWNFNQGTFTPGARARVTFHLENPGPNPLWISEINILFDFSTYTMSGINDIAPVGRSVQIASTTFDLPATEAGTNVYAIQYHLYEWVNNAWVDLGVQNPSERYYLNIFPAPFYRVFVSRGLHAEDRQVGDHIAQWIRDWGFETRTVGIEVQVPEDQVTAAILDEIQRSDAFIAIATPRHLDALSGMWRTLEFLHGETGIAFGLDKPMLIMQEDKIEVGGLPGYLMSFGLTPNFGFNRWDLNSLRNKVQAAMPTVRDAIATHRWQANKAILGKIALWGGLLLAGGGIGAGIYADQQKLRQQSTSPSDDPGNGERYSG